MTFSVTQFGKELSKAKYTWNENTRTFLTAENNLVLDFSEYDGCTFNTGYSCTVETGDCCTFRTGGNCTFKTGYGCTFDTGDCCTFKTGGSCTFNTGWDCTFTTDDGCTFDTCYNCAFTTGDNCMFKTGSSCTFMTGDQCTFNTGSTCTFKTGWNCVIVRRDVFEIVHPELGTIYKLCPNNIPGYLTKKEGENAFYMNIDNKRVEHIIADGILSKVVKKKGNVYHIINYGQNKETFLIKDGDIYSHGDTLEEAREGIKYKIADRDTTEFEKYKLDDEHDLTT